MEAIVIRLLGGTLPLPPRADAATMYGRPIDPAVALAAFLRNRRLEILPGIIIKPRNLCMRLGLSTCKNVFDLT